MPNYQAWEDRPLHPVTGVPADYFWELANGTRQPRWRDPFVKGPSLSVTWYSVPEVAKHAGVTLATVRRWLHKGQLPGSKPAGHQWFINGAALMRFLNGQSKVAPLPGAKEEPCPKPKRTRC